MNNYSSLITIHPEIRFGKPCIKGTRIAVDDILHWLASGISNENILEEHPQLRLEHIFAALYFAANREASVKIIPA